MTTNGARRRIWLLDLTRFLPVLELQVKISHRKGTRLDAVVVVEHGNVLEVLAKGYYVIVSNT